MLNIIHYSVQLLSHVQLFVTPWTATSQASLSITNSWNLLKLMSIESVMPSNHLILSHPLLLLHSFPASRSFLRSEFFTSGGQIIVVSASAPVLPMNIQGWFCLGLTVLISLQSKGLSRVFSIHSSKASVLRCSAFFMVQHSHPYVTIGKTIALTQKCPCPDLWKYNPLCGKRDHADVISDLKRGRLS